MKIEKNNKKRVMEEKSLRNEKPFSLITQEQKRAERMILDITGLGELVILLITLVFVKNPILFVILIAISIILFLIFALRLTKVIKNLKKAGYSIRAAFGNPGYLLVYYIKSYRKFLTGEKKLEKI